RYARSHRDGTISLRRVADDGEILRLKAAPPDSRGARVELRFGASDRFLAALFYYRTDRTLRVWNVGVDTAPRLEVTSTSGFCDFTPDDRYLVIGRSDNSIGVYELSTGHETRRLPRGLPPNHLAVAPDGRRLAVSSEKSPGLQIRELATGKVLHELAHRA